MKAVGFVLLAVGLSIAQAGDPRDDFWEAIKEHKVPVDHLATIGRFDYEILVNRDVSPPIAAARITTPSFQQFLKMSDKHSKQVMTEQKKLVDEYISSITGVPPAPTRPGKPIFLPKGSLPQLAPPPSAPTGSRKVPVRAEVPNDNSIYDCPETFSKEWRNLYWILNDDTVGIDNYGRPNDSWVIWDGPPSDGGVDKGCQQKVGHMGRPTGDDGGHLVARSLGGWMRRANIAPQNLELNRGAWTTMERAVSWCLTNAAGREQWWEVQPYYDDALGFTLRPYQYTEGYAINTADTCPPQWWTKQGPWIPNETPSPRTYTEIDAFATRIKDMCILVGPAPQPREGC